MWLHLDDGRVVPGHVLGYDQATGFGLVQVLAKLDLRRCRFGDRHSLRGESRGRRG